MNKFFISSAVALALTSTHLAAGPIPTHGDIARFETAFGEQLWLAKDNNGNGHGNDKGLIKDHGNAGKGNPSNGKAGTGKGNAKPGKGNDHAAKGNGKPEHAGGPKFKTNGKSDKGRRAFIMAEREKAFSRIVKGIKIPLRCVLGGFNRSSQQPDPGGCDEGAQASFGQINPKQIALARTTTGLAA